MRQLKSSDPQIKSVLFSFKIKEHVEIFAVVIVDSASLNQVLRMLVVFECGHCSKSQTVNTYSAPSSHVALELSCPLNWRSIIVSIPSERLIWDINYHCMLSCSCGNQMTSWLCNFYRFFWKIAGRFKNSFKCVGKLFRILQDCFSNSCLNYFNQILIKIVVNLLIFKTRWKSIWMCGEWSRFWSLSFFSNNCFLFKTKAYFGLIDLLKLVNFLN